MVVPSYMMYPRIPWSFHLSLIVPQKIHIGHGLWVKLGICPKLAWYIADVLRSCGERAVGGEALFSNPLPQKCLKLGVRIVELLLIPIERVLMDLWMRTRSIEVGCTSCVPWSTELVGMGWTAKSQTQVVGLSQPPMIGSRPLSHKIDSQQH